MNIVVVAEAKSARYRLLELLQDYSICEIGAVFDNAREARALGDNEMQVDAFIIHVPRSNSDLSSILNLRRYAEDAAIVVVSDDETMAARAFEVDAADYLVMPITVARFSETLRRINERYFQGSEFRRQSVLHVRDRGKHIFLGLHDVIYIEADQGVLTAHTADKRYMLDGSLKAIQARFDDEFLRIHRKTLVNKSYINQLEREEGVNILQLEGVDRAFSVSRRHVSNVTRWVKNLSN